MTVEASPQKYRKSFLFKLKMLNHFHLCFNVKALRNVTVLLA